MALRLDGAPARARPDALPSEERELELASAAEVADAIRRLAIRGAPLIGVAAAYGLALELRRDPATRRSSARATLLRAARPTAVNLAWAVDRVATRRAATRRPRERAAVALAEARAIHAEEDAASDAIAAPRRRPARATPGGS